MSRVISFDKGSRRRIQEIRWKRVEIISAVLLLLILSSVCIFVAFWEASRYRPFDPLPTPQVRDAERNDR